MISANMEIKKGSKEKICSRKLLLKAKAIKENRLTICIDQGIMDKKDEMIFFLWKINLSGVLYHLNL